MQAGAVLVLGGCIGKDLSQSSTPYYFPQAMPSYSVDPQLCSTCWVSPLCTG